MDIWTSPATDAGIIASDSEISTTTTVLSKFTRKPEKYSTNAAQMDRGGEAGQKEGGGVRAAVQGYPGSS